MNQPARTLTQPVLWQSLAALVRLGLYRFWQQALPMNSGLPNLLLEEARDLLPASDPSRWDQLVTPLQQRWPPADGALTRLIRDQRLTLADALLLTLLGEVERSHLISLVLAELQAPQRQPRPTVHLCCGWLDCLFGPGSLSALNLPQSPLVQSHLVKLESDQPLPLKTLRLQPGYWSVLLEQARGWPGCTLLEDGDTSLLPKSVLPQLPVLAQLLAKKKRNRMHQRAALAQLQSKLRRCNPAPLPAA